MLFDEFVLYQFGPIFMLATAFFVLR